MTTDYDLTVCMGHCPYAKAFTVQITYWTDETVFIWCNLFHRPMRECETCRAEDRHLMELEIMGKE